MNKVLLFFASSPFSPFSKDIKVYGWQKTYDYHLVSSASMYLFEELNITDNMVEKGKYNRPGDILPKHYITVHDTGDSDATHTAKFWSETVNKGYWEQGAYKASFQYVVGNDGIYHQIPDNEVAYHAGDGTKESYVLLDSGVRGNNDKPIISINEDGYYVIDGKKSVIKAPLAYIEESGKVVLNRKALTSDINTQGILCKNINGLYYLGNTYFNQTYQKIANRGGNNNSIGIESCINENSDIYYTWHLTAKLIAKLMDENHLTIDDVVQHHYFSGKNCPQTMRENEMWHHFIEMVKFEYQILLFQKEGYLIKFIPLSNNLKSNGRITKEGRIHFKLEVTYQNQTEAVEIIYQ